MERRKVGPYRWLVLETSRLEGDLFERGGERLMHIHLRTDLSTRSGYVGGSNTISMGQPAMTEAEFDEWAECFLRDHERAVMKHLAGIMHLGHEQSSSTDPG